jgi:hypothetical protein
MGYSDFKGLIVKENETFKGHLSAEDVNLVIINNLYSIGKIIKLIDNYFISNSSMQR